MATNYSLVDTDWTISETGDIRYIGAAHGADGASYATVIQFHRWLQDLADDAVASGDDILDITDSTPSNRQTDNIIELLSPYNIDQTASEHLYDGSIIQAGGDDIWDGFVNYGNSGIDIQVIQNGAVVSNDFWNNTPHVTGSGDPRGLNPLAASGISHRFMLKVRTAGADIDGRRAVGISREFGYTYAEFNVAGTARGNNTLALSNSTDLNNQTARATVATWSTISNVEGYQGIDINNDTVNEYYYSQWNRDTYTINQLYERTKWLTACETSLGGGAGTAATPNGTLYTLDSNIFRGITHKVSGGTPTGTFAATEAVSWATGSGIMVAIDSPTAGTTMWIQLLTGVAPVNTDVITGTSTATLTATGSVSYTPSPEFIGQSTGSAIIGAYGVGIEKLDLAATDSVEALDGVKYSTPNYVTYTVSGLDTGETYVLVGPESGGTFLTTQLSASGAYVGGETTFTVQEAIPSDTPATGTIRIWDAATGTFTRVTYTGWSVSSFTGCSGVPAASDGADVWISYIDVLASGASAQFTSIFSATRPLYVRARDGGTVNSTPIKTFESTSSLGSSGGSITVIKTNDY